MLQQLRHAKSNVDVPALQAVVCNAFAAICDGNVAQLSYEHAYRSIYNLVVYGGQLHWVLAELKQQVRQMDVSTKTLQECKNTAEWMGQICLYVSRVAHLDVSTWVTQLLTPKRVWYGRQEIRNRIRSIGKCAILLQDWYVDVTFRPGHQGANACKTRFESGCYP